MERNVAVYAALIEKHRNTTLVPVRVHAMKRAVTALNNFYGIAAVV